MTARFVFCLLLLVPEILLADVVKPALVEINVNTNGTYRVEIRASIEALLTGINAKYKNTQDAPNAEAYDRLRVMAEDELTEAWLPFHDTFTKLIELRLDGKRVPLEVTSTKIPEPGYPKIPRISVINLEGQIDRDVSSLDWYYPARFGDNAVRVRQVDDANQRWHWSDWQWIRDDARSDPFPLGEIFTRTPWYVVVKNYTVAGFQHIVPTGMDHILFILGLFLLSRRFRPLLMQVTMFTIAHTITLGLATKGLVDLPERWVQPLIALSIAYVGVENIFAHRLHNSRLALVFGFGLLHGLGFAAMLKEFGMPADAFATALISFNIGVELGQLAVLVLASLLLGIWFKHREWYRGAVTIPGSLLIAVTGLYWTWDRLVI